MAGDVGPSVKASGKQPYSGPLSRAVSGSTLLDGAGTRPHGHHVYDQEGSHFCFHVGSQSRTCSGLLRGAQLSPADLTVTLGGAGALGLILSSQHSGPLVAS